MKIWANNVRGIAMLSERAKSSVCIALSTQIKLGNGLKVVASFITSKLKKYNAVDKHVQRKT